MKVQVQNVCFLRLLNLRQKWSTFRKSNMIRMRTDCLDVANFVFLMLLTYRFVIFVKLLKTSCARFLTLLLDRSLKVSRENVFQKI